MADSLPRSIHLAGARQHNLRSVEVTIPHAALTVITGVSGSGKSSLAHDTLFREGQRRYLASWSSHARARLGQLERPEFDRVEGLLPALAVDQRAVVRSPRSTVGTLTELYDHLRLLFARVGEGAPVGGPVPAASGLSFNSPLGACPACEGLGVEDRVDPGLLIADPQRTLREGALVPTTPTGYIVYSQVTVDVLDRVCRAHGFSVDVPWQELDEEQQRVVLYGSDRIVVPFGKHPLESRMKWTGITARPREEGTYRGIIPVIEEILGRNRNRNALRFARTAPCHACGGARLRPEALALRVDGRTIAAWAAQPLEIAARELAAVRWPGDHAPLAAPVVQAFADRAARIVELGLGYLPLDRPSPSLSAGEVQRLKLATMVSSGLRGLLYVLDEPSVGLHGRDTGRLLRVLGGLRDAGNAVVVVEHDPATIRAADWLIDVGPGAGSAGGRVLYEGPPRGLLGPAPPGGAADDSVTRAYLTGACDVPPPTPRTAAGGMLWVRGARGFNLQDLDVPFALGALNVVTGVSGAGKTTLVERTLGRALRRRLYGATDQPAAHARIEGAGGLDKVIVLDQAPIGRTPRSNPATYTKVFDPIRALFAALPGARERGWGKGHFSLNTAGGRCEACHGAGVQTVGMHFLGDVAVTCPACQGRRFDTETLALRYRDHSVRDVLTCSVDAAAELFADQPRIHRVLEALCAVGLGYLPLGQPSTTLSGGEAQRVKLASELGRPTTGHTLLLLDEPTRGLHLADVDQLLGALRRLVQRGNTVVVVEHDPAVIRAADHVVDLGPEGGPEGGRLVACGSPDEIAAVASSATGAVLRGEVPEIQEAPRAASAADGPIRLSGVTTHTLRDLDVEIPVRCLTVVTGVSGSGKSSLAFDTLLEECRARFAEGLSTEFRRRAGASSAAQLRSAHGLTPATGIGPHPPVRNPRSTVSTMTELRDGLRLLFSRAGEPRQAADGSPLRASDFSFNDTRGACPTCRGLGSIPSCDAERLITDASRSLLDGAMDGHKTGRYYGDAVGRHVALLRTVGAEHGVDFGRPWAALEEGARRLALEGTGAREYDVEWRYQRGRRRGTHRFRAPWLGLIAYVDEEYQRKHADHRGEAMRALMIDRTCDDCGGERLAAEFRSVRVAGQRLAELEGRSVDDLAAWFASLLDGSLRDDIDRRTRAVAAPIAADLGGRLRSLQEVGVGYLTPARAASSLSGGEFQRVRLAAQLNARLCGVTYVLDEPTTGLHARDIRRLLAVLRRLRDEGNTVVVVEHDLTVIRAADHVIDLGPGAGVRGGRIVAQGPPGALAVHPDSVTGEFLRADGGERPDRAPRGLGPGIRVEGASARNLRGVDVTLPGDGLVVVSGVSGSGKSALLFDVVAASLQRGRAVGCAAVHGGDAFDAVVALQGSPPSGGARVTVASRCGAFDLLRARFARAETARSRGWGKGWFSLHARGGRCGVCEGTGRRCFEMGFLPEVVLLCPACGGGRYRPEAGEVRVDGLAIDEVLARSVDQALAWLPGHRPLVQRLRPLVEVGLGYLRLGQPVDTLSGGERQRLLLARGLGDEPPGERALYLLDEPTRGLHPADVERLLGTLERLVDAGHSVVVIEHDLAVIRAADHVVDLGPEGGAGGGRVVASGPPPALAGHPTSHTAAALRGDL